MPRPHVEDQQHNLLVGNALRVFIEDLASEGAPRHEIDRAVGLSVNAVAGAAWDLGQHEALIPSRN